MEDKASTDAEHKLLHELHKAEDDFGNGIDLQTFHTRHQRH
ncbi:hypothetical protein OZX65_01180 [Leuconostocaceae bacterium ESL0723]|nr:hypothetical protein OZX65_01180 [Leuconostocaceae bacterium ESL0723]